MSVKMEGARLAMIIALAGRRIDALDATTPRFPLANRDLVHDRLRAALAPFNADALVCSAACGCDLLALEVAGELGMERQIILPFGARRFRRVSVTDRPGAWGPLFDRIYYDAKSKGHVQLMRGHGWGHTAYEAATRRILDHALVIASGHGSDAPERAVTAIAVWDMAPRGPDDLTAHFLADAKSRELATVEISTL